MKILFFLLSIFQLCDLVPSIILFICLVPHSQLTIQSKCLSLQVCWYSLLLSWACVFKFFVMGKDSYSPGELLWWSFSSQSRLCLWSGNTGQGTELMQLAIKVVATATEEDRSHPGGVRPPFKERFDGGDSLVLSSFQPADPMIC